MPFTPKKPRFGIWKIQFLGQDPETGTVFEHAPLLRRAWQSLNAESRLKLVLGSISLSGWAAAAAAWYPLLTQPECVDHSDVRKSSEQVSRSDLPSHRSDLALQFFNPFDVHVQNSPLSIGRD